MLTNEPILLIEDDLNDIEVINAALIELDIPHPLKIFYTAQEGYDYLLTTTQKPFVILCDIRMPAINGLSFRKMIMDNTYLKNKSIPFVFFTGAVSQEIVNEAYLLDVQGFYKKGNSFTKIKEQLSAIYTYWKGCLHPNKTVK
jgi:CheY-like chemotaxis protein